MKNSLEKILFLSLFVLIISAPLVGKKTETTLEKRELASFPEWRWSNVWSFFTKYQDYFEDRYAFRNDLIAFSNKTEIKLFNISANRNLIEMGNDNWLYGSKPERIFSTSNPFTERELDTIELNLNIKLKIREEVQNKEINTEILYKILMSLLLESINRIYNNGSISVEFKLKNLQMIEMRYTDNLYNINIKEEEDVVKQRLKKHLFYLDQKNIKELLSQNNGVYEENEILHKRKEVIINVPIVTEQLPSNIISIKSFIKDEKDEV